MKKVSRPASRSGPLAMPTSGTSLDAEPRSASRAASSWPLPAVDQHQIGPGRKRIAGSASRALMLLLQPREAPAQHLAHHAEIVARRQILERMLKVR
jgi:hypothetical protein